MCEGAHVLPPCLIRWAPINLCRSGSLVGFYTVSVSENEIVCYDVGMAVTNANVRGAGPPL